MTTRTRPKKRAAFVSRCDVQSLLLVSLPPLPSTSSTKSIYEWYNCLRPEKLDRPSLCWVAMFKGRNFFQIKYFAYKENTPFPPEGLLFISTHISLDTRCVLLMQPLTRVMSYHAICQVVELEYLSATSKGCWVINYIFAWGGRKSYCSTSSLDWNYSKGRQIEFTS